MTSLDAVNLLYTHLQATLMQSAGKPTGGLYRYRRPLDSKGEDVVVNSLPMNREQVQRTVLNVNLHVPNLILGTDATQPNAKRLKELGTLACNSIGEVWGKDHQFAVEQENVFADEGNSHYLNIRVAFSAINL